jgi:ectoine hydroxylase
MSNQGQLTMLTPEDIATYEKDGMLVLPDLLAPEEVEELKDAFERDSRIPGEHRVIEPDGDAVRAVYASHLRQPVYTALARDPRILRPAQQLLARDLYLYQLKINAKPGFGGDGWAWHQDYIAWKIADDVPGPQLINFVIFLDSVSEFNGPIVFVPGSHLDGQLRDDRSSARRSEQHLDPDDIALSPEQMRGLVDRHGMYSPKGGAGTVVIFHPEIVHGSAANLSPYPRRVVIATYNEVHNTPRGRPRPEYLVCRDTRPLTVPRGVEP